MLRNNQRPGQKDEESSRLLSGPPAFDDVFVAGSAANNDSTGRDDDLLQFPQIPSATQERAPLYSPLDDQLIQLPAQAPDPPPRGFRSGDSMPYNHASSSSLDDDMLQLDDAVAIPSNVRPDYTRSTDHVYAEIGPATSGLTISGATQAWNEGRDAASTARVSGDSRDTSAGLYLEVDGSIVGDTRGSGADLMPAVPAQAAVQPSSDSNTHSGSPGADTPAEDFRRPVTFIGGQLPDDFLTLMVKTEVPFDSLPNATQNGLEHAAFPESGVITVFLQQAKLAKNYGIGRMDPYVRLSVGPNKQCSRVCINGAKAPFWNSSVTVNVPEIQDFSLKVEVLSQGTFSDRLVGWTEIPIIEAYQGKKIEGWFSLTGKQGKDKEGMVNLWITFKSTDFLYQPVPGIPNGYALQPAPPLVHGQIQGRYGLQFSQSTPGVPYSQPPPVVDFSGGHQVPPIDPSYRQYPQGVPAHYQPGYVQQGHPTQPQYHIPSSQPTQQPSQSAVTPPSQEAVRQLKDMFPVFDDQIIVGVLEGTQGDMEEAIESLLAMS